MYNTYFLLDTRLGFTHIISWF